MTHDAEGSIAVRIQCRRMTVADLGEIHRLYMKLNQQVAQADAYQTIDENESYVGWMFRNLRQNLLSQRRYVCHVAVYEEHLIGYCAAVIHLRSDMYRIKRYGELDELYVEEAFRSRGVGQTLLDRVIESLRQSGIEHYEANCPAGLESALEYLRKRGFVDSSVKLRRFSGL